MFEAAGVARVEAPQGAHFVQFYEQDSYLAEEVANYIGTALRTGHTGIVIARPHLVADLKQRVNRRRAPLFGFGNQRGELITLDAQETLDRFLVDGWPDETRFGEVVGTVVANASRGGKMVRAFGEMVALLCEQGRYDAAVRLEELWNGLGGIYSFSLFCAYPMRLFADAADSKAFQHICGTHTHVTPTETAGPVRSAEHGLTLAALQQKTLALEKAMAEREKMLAELTAANRAKDEFLAMLGHELRNPLSPIVTALDLMKLRGDKATEREQTLIRRQVGHLLRLVDDLLDVSRITRGRVDLRKENARVADVLAKAVEMAGPLIEQREHRLTVDLTEPDLSCVADPVRMAQVVSNLLTNAARYTPPGGQIHLQALRRGDELEISVADNGNGIALEMQGPIFEMFLQGLRKADRHQGGLGIGLALVKSLIELHGGTVGVFSEGLGRGSRFTLRLPLTASERHAAPAAAEPPQPTTAPLGRVLVVDDNTEAADFLGELLSAYGHDIRVVYDPAMALELIDEFRPEVAILDIGLPVMDGYELAGRIRQRLNASECRLIALSGYGQETDRLRSAACGFDLHLVKPVDAASIATAIRRC